MNQEQATKIIFSLNVGRKVVMEIRCGDRLARENVGGQYKGAGLAKYVSNHEKSLDGF